MNKAPLPFAFWTVGRLAWLMGLTAGLAVVLTLGDPGITIDEPLDVRPGRTYVATLKAKGWQFFQPETVRLVFADNAEHPPLGRWLLGLASTLGEPFEFFLGGSDPYSVHAGRLAPATAFALLVGLVALAAGRRHGRSAAIAAGFALLVMPRVFAHAHLAALDTFLCLFWTLALLQADRALSTRRPITAMACAGLFWGLALLTKIHAWLLPPIVLAWAIRKIGLARSIPAVVSWTVSGLVVFVAGWPWLWYHSLDRAWGYLVGTSLQRVSLHVQYFGRVFADREVPWHYPWFYFAVTVPVGLHLLGLVGLVRGWNERRGDGFPLLLLAAILLFLVLFSTNVAVYDGERLFLVAFPLWAVLIGTGFATAWSASARSAWSRRALVGLLLAQGYGVVALHPFGLSYFNAAVGGLPGASRLGLELTYWGDAVDRVLLDELARRARPGDSAAVAPTLHHLQAAATFTPELLAKPVALVDESAVGRSNWVVLYRRTAYWKPEAADISGTRPVFLRKRQGVWLSGLWQRPDTKSP
jgi:4-amino-4-deoxy-L-arabinose transferase-like glycosyltransferase